MKQKALIGSHCISNFRYPIPIGCSFRKQFSFKLNKADQKYDLDIHLENMEVVIFFGQKNVKFRQMRK